MRYLPVGETTLLKKLYYWNKAQGIIGLPQYLVRELLTCVTVGKKNPSAILEARVKNYRFTYEYQVSFSIIIPAKRVEIQRFSEGVKSFFSQKSCCTRVNTCKVMLLFSVQYLQGPLLPL